MSRRRLILVVYHANEPRVRATFREHLYSFQRYADADCVYLNLGFRRVSRRIRSLPVDLVVFHYSWMAHIRWNRRTHSRLAERAEPLSDIHAAKVAIVQDEIINTDLLCQFLIQQHVSHVFSCAQPRDWPVIYPGLQENGVGISTILTGYIGDETLNAISRLTAAGPPKRSVDVGYRVRPAMPWLGRDGQLKAQVADVVAAAARRHGMDVDISTCGADTLLGPDWLEFLLGCRTTIGAEGGASMIDRDGSIRERTDRYLATHPGATFDEVEASCFPGLDGSLSLRALSPRHLEACVTRTAQILVEGEYGGVLRPWQHYLPLKRDFSNVDEVITQAKQASVRARITESAYQDIVASGRFHYRTMVAEVMRLGLSGRPMPTAQGARRWTLAYLYLTDVLTWRYLALRRMVRTPARMLLRGLRAHGLRRSAAAK